MSERPDDLVRAVEAALFAAEEPLSPAQLAAHLEGADVGPALAALAAHYAGRGVELVERGGRWHFQTAPDLAHILRRTREEPRRLSRAATETLAIVAYHQPVTRAEIEDIRGVAVSRGTLDQLIEMGWVRLGRRRQTPGRPVTFVVTEAFLDHFGLENTRDLPGLSELRAAGLLDTRPPEPQLPGMTPLAGDTEDADISASDEPGEDLFGD